MTRLMYDSVTPGSIPQSAAMVAGYVDGRYAWSAEGWARFPHAVHVPIAVFASTNAGVVLDVETGDATPAQAPGWVQRRRAAGVDPSVYCNTSVWPSVRAAFTSAGVAQPHYWVAAYPGGGAVIPSGAIAHQYADPLTSGGNFDLSVVADYWPGVDQGGIVELTDRLPNGATVADALMDRMLGQQGKWTAVQPSTAYWELDQFNAVQSSIAALAAKPTVTVDASTLVQPLVDALLPHMPASSDPAVIAAAVLTALRSQLEKP